MDYELRNNIYVAIPKDHHPDKIELELGDSKEPNAFLPQAKIMRWDNECNVSLRLLDFEGFDVKSLKDEVRLIGQDKEVRFYNLPVSDNLPEGGHEFEIVLKKKPLTNVTRFSLVDKDVEYFYQPALTSEEIKKGFYRPENVIGSYAVYAKTQKDNYVGGKEYKCAKIGHFLRPLITDSSGKKVWGELHIENGILSVTIPEDFWNNVVYPIRHAAGDTFGYTTVGASQDDRGSADSCGSSFAGAAGTSDSISVYMEGVGAPFGVGIYLHSTGAAVDYSDDFDGSTPASFAWETVNLTGATISAVDYVVACGANQSNYSLKYDAGSANQGHYINSGGSFTMNETKSFSHNNNKYSIYCTYTPSGGGTAVKDLIQPGIIPFAR